MTRKKSTRLPLFCEWMVGTTIPNALGPLPKRKPPKKPTKSQRVVKVEVLTDDETEEDTLKITYPRTGGSKKVPTRHAKDVTVKKVRFKDAPKKSAMKKTTSPASSSEEEEDEEEEEEAEAEEQDSETDAEAKAAAESTDTSNATSSDDSQTAKKAKRKKSKKAAAKSPDSEDDCETGSACDCDECVRGLQKQIQKEKGKEKEKQKQKQKSQTKKCTKKAELSDSDTDEPKKDCKPDKPTHSKGNKNGKSNLKEQGNKDVDVVESSGKESSGEETCGSDSDKEATSHKKQKKNKNKKKDKNKAQAEQGDPKPAKEDTPKNGPEKQNPPAKEDTPAEGNEHTATVPDDKPADTSEPITTTAAAANPAAATSNVEKPGYPAGFPGPHARRPNLIEPIRAQVVHTERVVETPEDPPPNAYYDVENNIVRIYYGPAYGYHGHSLYPKRDPSHLPLPVGMPHPAQNPYYHGFERGPEKLNNLEHVPITQGMHIAPWNAYCPPPAAAAFHGYAGYPGAFPPPRPPPPPETKNNKGVFSVPAAPSSKDQDISGANNVFPPAAAAAKDHQNPYYLPKRSPFSNMGSSHGGGSNNHSPRGPANKTNKKINQASSSHEKQQPQRQQQSDHWGSSTRDQPPEPGWGNNDTANQQSTWSDGNGNGNGNGQQDTSPPTKQDGQSWPGAEAAAAAGDTAWGSTDVQDGHPAESTWDNQPTQNTDSGGGNAEPGWEQGDQTNNDGSWGENNNIMPGGWETTPAWGDPTMAASTKGKVNDMVW
ncbi:hypothetical protein E4U43_000152 [Claviceps pusilla]|uniref:Uncharacterized protein n=1 Tax=Claviceps pusilla TaxID=123648 RepID=A0A9P7SXX1_9HYPO|nr:hypothetical protein E4U43_000152 [Claviceps pusilla]